MYLVEGFKSCNQRSRCIVKLGRTASATLSAMMLALLAAAAGQPPTTTTTTITAEYCDMCGASASYAESFKTDSRNGELVRVITTNGCPNHYGVCTGKGTGVCGNLGEEGTGTEAYIQNYTFEIPAYPVIATATTDKVSTTLHWPLLTAAQPNLPPRHRAGVRD